MNEGFAPPFKIQFHAGFRQLIFDVDFIFLIRRKKIWIPRTLQNAFSQARFIILRKSRFLSSRLSQNTAASMKCVHHALPRYTPGIIELVKYVRNGVAMCRK